MSADEVRDACLRGRLTAKRLKAMGYTKVFGLKIPLELETDGELAEGITYLRRCRDEAAFYDNTRKYNRLLESTNAVEAEIARRKETK